MEMVDFRQMPYARPDVEALKAAYRDTTKKLKDAQIPVFQAAKAAVLPGKDVRAFQQAFHKKAPYL